MENQLSKKIFDRLEESFQESQKAEAKTVQESRKKTRERIKEYCADRFQWVPGKIELEESGWVVQGDGVKCLVRFSEFGSNPNGLSPFRACECGQMVPSASSAIELEYLAKLVKEPFTRTDASYDHFSICTAWQQPGQDQPKAEGILGDLVDFLVQEVIEALDDRDARLNEAY